MGFNEVDKVAQERALGSHLKPESLPDTEVGVELYMDNTWTHGVSPIHGSATSDKVARSNLA